MKKVLRYALDEFLQFVNDHDSVFDNREDRYVECNIVMKMDDGSYRVLIGNYMCEAQFIDDTVVAFHDHDIYLDPTHFDIEKRCMAYNDKLYLLDNPEGFIDELFILGTTEAVEPRQTSPRLEKVIKKINSENLSTVEQVELLMENYEEETQPFIRL